MSEGRNPTRNEAEVGSIRRRLEDLQAAMTGAPVVAADAHREILRARARILARERDDREAEEDCLQVVEFQLAHERYAVESAHVREAYPLRDPTPLPCTPEFVLGIINVRGQILTVIDLKRFFGLPAGELGEQSKVIIVQGDGMVLGILADSIVGVRTVPRRDLQPALPTLTAVCTAYLQGLTEHLAVLDVRAILSDRRLIVQEEVDTQ
jgi:purine-binding chemotaxis protein CheW